MNLARFLWLVFGAVAASAIVCIPYRSLTLALGSTPSIAGTSLVIGLAALLMAIKGSEWGSVRLRRLPALVGTLTSRRWLILTVFFGIVLRVLWVAWFEPRMTGDERMYFRLAQDLYEKGIYMDARGERAFYPPGYPLFLYAGFLMFGVKTWIPVAANLFLYCATTCIVFKLARLLAGEEAAKLATLFLALWPNHILHTGIANKEMLLATLLASAVYLYVKSFAEGFNAKKRYLLYLFPSGLLLGWASLAQPSMLLLPGVFFIDAYLRGRRFGVSVLRLIVIALGMSLVIAPWSVRNYVVFNEVVPISTNGGDVFYRSNNPLATGGYTQRGERSLVEFSEVERNRIGYRWGLEWVRSNPAGFLYLALQKQIRFWDDGYGAYASLKEGLGIGGAAYLLWKGISNAYWLLIWVLILGLWISRDDRFRHGGLLLGMLVIYLLAIDSVFEGEGTHHEPLIGLLAVMAAAAANAWAAPVVNPQTGRSVFLASRAG